MQHRRERNGYSSRATGLGRAAGGAHRARLPQDGNQDVNRRGPRLVASLEILAEMLHAAVLTFGPHGPGWQQCGG